MTSSIKQWEVWYGDFPFEEDQSISKSRPIIVLDATTIMILSIKVTKTDRSSFDDFDYPIYYWKEAGLDSPSVARISKIMEVNENAFICKIGDLHPEDIEGVKITIRDFYEKTNSVNTDDLVGTGTDN